METNDPNAQTPKIKIIYLGGPISGCTDSECFGWRNKATILLKDFYVIDPTTRGYRGFEYTTSADLIVKPDRDDIIRSDILLVNPFKISVGTSMEIMLGWEYSKTIIIVSKEFENLSPWIRYHSHAKFESIEMACNYIRKLPQSF